MSDIVERLNEYSNQWHPEDVADLITDAADEIERLRTCVKTLTGQLQYIGDIATATAEDAKRWKEAT